MDLEKANELLKNLLFPGGKFDPKGYQQLAELGIVSEREAADEVLKAPTKSTADRIRENTAAAEAQEDLIIRSGQRKIGYADELDKIGSRGFGEKIGAVQAANRENLGMAYGDMKDARQTMSGDYNKYMDIQQEINLTIYDEFEKRGIEFAYPTQTLFVERTASGTPPQRGEKA